LISSLACGASTILKIGTGTTRGAAVACDTDNSPLATIAKRSAGMAASCWARIDVFFVMPMSARVGV
jgi:hypothetical protein